MKNEEEVLKSFVNPLDFCMTAKINEEILNILTITPWDSETIRDVGKKEILQNQRNHILSLLQYEVGPSSSVSNKTKNSSNRNKEKRDELDSYDALVRDAGMILYLLKSAN